MAYTPHSWTENELITVERLNALEQGLSEASQQTPVKPSTEPYRLIVESANGEYEDDTSEHKFGFTVDSPKIRYAYFDNTEIESTQGEKSNGRYFVFARGDLGCCLVNENGEFYYLYYDFPIHNPVSLSGHFNNFSAGNFKLVLNGDTVTITETGSSASRSITLAQTNEIMGTLGLENMKEMKLGFSTAQPSSVNASFFHYVVLGDIPSQGGGEEEPEEPSVSRKTVACLGDSLTAQNQYTTALQNLGYTVLNYGVSGTTLSNITSSNTFGSRVSAMSDDCDFVFVLGGTNDWGQSAPLGTKEDTTEDTFYGGLYVTLNNLRTKYPTKSIFISEILQRNWQSGGQSSGIDSNENSNSIAEFNEAICYMAERFGCFLVPSYSCGITVSNSATYLSDGVHLNSLGGQKLAIFLDTFFKMYPIYTI